MMTHLTGEEEYLLLGKAGGLLSPAEEAAWERLVKEKPAALIAYEELLKELQPADGAGDAGLPHHTGNWKDLAAYYKETPAAPLRKPSRYSRWAVAAAVLLLAALGATAWWGLHRPAQERHTTISHNDKSIELQLASGQLVDLSAQQGAIHTGTALLNNADKTLTYTPAAGAADAAAINSLTVPIGMDYHIRLADGTEVWLNSATKLDFPMAFAGHTREITISGEAFLKVAKDASRPFVVHLPGSTVQVLGTEFNVNTYDPDVVKVALVEGKVNMRGAADETILAPGNEAVYHRGQPIEQRSFDAKRVLGWRNGLFYFDGATLLEISKVLPRWFGIRTVIDDPAINSRRFAGVLDRKQPVQVFLEDLKTISKISTYFDSDSTLHFK